MAIKAALGQYVGKPAWGPSASKSRNRRLASIRLRHSSALSRDMLPQSSNTPTSQRPSRMPLALYGPGGRACWFGAWGEYAAGEEER